MSSIYDEWKKTGNVPLQEMSPKASGLPKEESSNQVPVTAGAEPHIVNISMQEKKSGMGAGVLGVLSATALILAGGYYLHTENSTEAEGQDSGTEQVDPNGAPLYEISNSPNSPETVSAVGNNEVRETGCQRQLAEVDGVDGAYTRTGSNTDFCWEMGEMVTSANKTRGVVIFWGESPNAGVLDDAIIREKFETEDISKNELHAFFRSFVMDSLLETNLVLVDRNGENYEWPINGINETVVVDMQEQQR